MAEMQPKKCEGRELTKDQLAAHPWLAPGMASATAVMEDAPVDYDLDA